MKPPEISPADITSLGSKPKPMFKLEEIGYKQWLIKSNRKADSKAWTDYMLRQWR